MTRSYEDFSLGETISLPAYQVDEQEMVAFAERYDPQYFHTDADAARRSPFAGLIASGWLTTAIAMRMQCDGFLGDSSCVGSPGVDEIRWLLPVRPGDILCGTIEVTGLRPSLSRPDRGLVTSAVTIRNQAGERVMTLTTLAIYLRRQPS